MLLLHTNYYHINIMPLLASSHYHDMGKSYCQNQDKITEISIEEMKPDKGYSNQLNGYAGSSIDCAMVVNFNG